MSYSIKSSLLKVLYLARTAVKPKTSGEISKAYFTSVSIDKAGKGGPYFIRAETTATVDKLAQIAGAGLQELPAARFWHA